MSICPSYAYFYPPVLWVFGPSSNVILDGKSFFSVENIQYPWKKTPKLHSQFQLLFQIMNTLFLLLLYVLFTFTSCNQVNIIEQDVPLNSTDNPPADGLLNTSNKPCWSISCPDSAG